MTKLSEEKRKEIEDKVDEYILSIKELTHTPETLSAFLISGVLVGMDREEKLCAKVYFKTKLPYKEWVKIIRSDPQALGDDMLHFRKLQEEEY